MAKISVKLDPFDPSNLPTEIRVYEGNLEDSLLLQKITSQNGPIEISVYINKKYTVTATYYNQGMIYTAIDSSTPKTRLESKRCEEPCYYVIDNIVDLRIRYTR